MKRISQILNPIRPISYGLSSCKLLSIIPSFQLSPRYFSSLRTKIKSPISYVCQSQSNFPSLFSPLGIEHTLRPLYHSSSGHTKKILNEILPQPSFNENSCDYSDTLNIGTSIWINKTDGFKLKFKETHYTQIFYGSFNDSEIMMNNWIKAKTNGLTNIPKLDDEFDMVIINAINFNGIWEQAFTGKQLVNFIVNQDVKIPIVMMHQLFDSISYYSGRDTIMIELPFRDNFSMVLILNKHDLQAPKISEEKTLWEMLSLAKKEKVDVIIPKFRIENEHNLKDLLVTATSQELKGPYKGFGNIPLVLGDVIQKCALDINERGINKELPITNSYKFFDNIRPKKFYTNRPFTFSVIHPQSKKIILTGEYRL